MLEFSGLLFIPLGFVFCDACFGILRLVACYFVLCCFICDFVGCFAMLLLVAALLNVYGWFVCQLVSCVYLCMLIVCDDYLLLCMRGCFAFEACFCCLL